MTPVKYFGEGLEVVADRVGGLEVVAAAV